MAVLQEMLGRERSTFMASRVLGMPWCSHSVSPNPQKDTGKGINPGCWVISGG